MNTENITLETIESDFDKLKRDIIAYYKTNKVVKGDTESFKKMIMAEMDMPNLDTSTQETINRISQMMKEISDVIIVSHDMPSIGDDNEDFLEKGVPGAWIAEALSSLPKLSDEAINAIEAGSKDMRNMNMPDSAWD